MISGDGLFARLARTRQSLSGRLGHLFTSSARLDESVYEEIEDHLIMADMGVATARSVTERLRKKAASGRVSSRSELPGMLKDVIVEVLGKDRAGLPGLPETRPAVVLMVGVNGVGKTTTLAKLAHYCRTNGHSVMMAACDTFRAAAIEQLQAWGERLDIPVVAQAHGSDAAAVAFDALSSARARQMDYLLIDSAGRQHTQGGLMDQLGKIRRVLGKIDETAPHEVLLTVDAGNGQNVLSQVESFNRVIPLTGLCVAKLDGTARGGVVVSLAGRHDLPIRFVGLGEGIEDIRPFSAEEFVAALVPDLTG